MGQQMSAVSQCCGPCSADQAKQFRGLNGDMDGDMKKMNLEKSGVGELDKNFFTSPSTPGTASTSGTPGGTPGSRFSESGGKVYTFRNMTRTDYFELYDAIHTLVRQGELTKEEENRLYDMIGRQDKKLAAAYQRYKENGDPMVILEPLKEKMSTRSSVGSRLSSGGARRST